MFTNNEKNNSLDQRPMVMIIEDSVDQSAYLTYILNMHDYQVMQVRDPYKALQLMKGGLRPDVLLTDVSMPQMSGFELMEKMHGLEIEIPTIIISGVQNEQAFEKAFVLGAEDYFVKPFSPLSLLSRLQKVLLSKVPC
jgi:PleD family two-component response regulator